MRLLISECTTRTMKMSDRFKVCVVTTSFPRYKGDYYGTYTYELVNALSPKHEEHVIYLMYPSTTKDSEATANPFYTHPIKYPYETYPLSQIQGFKVVGLIPLFIRMLMKIRVVVKKHNVNVIHAHCAIPSGFFASLSCGKIPVLITLEGSDIMIFARKWWAKYPVKYALRKATKIIAVNVDLKTKAIELGAQSDKIVVLPDGVDINKFKPMPKKTLRLKMGLPDDFLVLFVGSLYPLKRVDRLIKISARLTPDFRFHLVIVGDGSERSNLETLVRQMGLENVIFTGNIPNDEVPFYMAASDVLVLPSESEALPTCVQEAMACGLPVVTNNVGGLPDLITNGANGYLANNEMEMEKCLRQLMSSPELVASMGGKALDFARQNLSIDRIADQIEGLYLQVTSQS